jgi:hypothetical protein
MITQVEEPPVVNAQIWHAWVQKGKLQERASMRELKLCGGSVLGFLAVETAFYVVAGG